MIGKATASFESGAGAVLVALSLVAMLVAVGSASGQDAAPSPDNDVAMKAVRDEMARSIEKLHLDTNPGPTLFPIRCAI